MGAEAPLPFPSERALEQEAEDRRLDEPPVEGGRLAQLGDLLGRQVDARRCLEELPVRPRCALVQTVLRPIPRCVQDLEQLAEIVSARPSLILNEPDEELREELVREQAEVLREHAPDALEDEVAQRVGGDLLPGLHLGEQRCHEFDSAPRELSPVGGEVGLEPLQEAERRCAVRQLFE